MGENAPRETAQDLSFYEQGGFGCTIHGESVLLGTASFLRKQDVRLPSNINLKTGIFLAIDHQLAAVFAVKYEASENVDYALRTLRRSRITPILAVRDPNITPALLKRKFYKKIKVEYPQLTDRLSAAAKAKRVNEHTNPAHKWVALAIVLAGLIAAIYGIIAWRRQEDFGMYFTLLGLAVVFLFSGTQVIPTMKNNKRAVTAAWEQAQKDMAGVLPEHFPLPARYAHPVVLDRMIRVLREGRAQSAEEALAVVKADLKALNADVQVSQEEYDEVVAIKPMFLVSDYE